MYISLRTGQELHTVFFFFAFDALGNSNLLKLLYDMKGWKMIFRVRFYLEEMSGKKTAAILRSIDAIHRSWKLSLIHNIWVNPLEASMTNMYVNYASIDENQHHWLTWPNSMYELPIPFKQFNDCAVIDIFRLRFEWDLFLKPSGFFHTHTHR